MRRKREEPSRKRFIVSVEISRLGICMKLTICVFLYLLGNHSAFFAPVLEPSLTVASDCYSVAALACLHLL